MLYNKSEIRKEHEFFISRITKLIEAVYDFSDTTLSKIADLEDTTSNIIFEAEREIDKLKLEIVELKKNNK